ncbi:MAG TPA: sigma-70 family RNA polymerase sigma factor [Herbaspirillum sp.]|uniref:sigma-70 family RNA polymerase sigma factor n=1 Tax=Herbaspirillum sp. TaxID=1890675 RepID=UPI002D64E45D|nr:sigma-70 family RNA polymerase sigma factor [Herbaspirillum sp.]HZG18868.1 sigma-70 family RNA polymerase sigma factor [Herbaspirillum sp.]
MTSSITSEAQLACASDRSTVQHLYLAHHNWLQSLLRSKLRDSHQAADLAHDTFVAILKSSTRSAHLEALREPRAYLRTVAHGVLVDFFRRRALESAYLEALAALPETAAPSPEERLLILEALHRIDALLDALPAKTRTVFLLSQLEGQGYSQIAETMAISSRTVKRHMQAAFTACLEAML